MGSNKNRKIMHKLITALLFPFVFARTRDYAAALQNVMTQIEYEAQDDLLALIGGSPRLCEDCETALFIEPNESMEALLQDRCDSASAGSKFRFVCNCRFIRNLELDEQLAALVDECGLGFSMFL